MSLSFSPEQRSLRARLAANTKWAHEPDPRAATASARRAFLARFDREVDPDGKLSPEERRRRAEYAKKAYFARLALASSRTRRSRRCNARREVQDE